MARKTDLIWTLPALDDLDEIAGWIAFENERAAGRLVKRVIAAVERLRQHPSSGRWVPELPRGLYREVIARPCRVIYRLDGNAVVVVHVFRGEQQLNAHRLL